MKYCAKCGKQMNDGDNFCPSCGTPQTNGLSQQASEYADSSDGPSYTYDTSDGSRPMYTYDSLSVEQQLQNMYSQNPSADGKVRRVKKKKQKSKRRLIPLFGAAAVLIILFLVFFFRYVTGSGSLTKNGAVKAYYGALHSKDGEALLDAMVSDSLLKAIEEDSGFDKERIVRLMRASITASSTNYKYRRIRITNSEKYDKSEISDFVRKIDRQMGASVKISDMSKVEVTYEVWNSYYEEWQESTAQLVLYKSGGKWYVMPDNLDF